MSGGALGAAAGQALRRNPTQGSVLASTLLLAGSQALGVLLEPTGVKRGTFNDFQVSPGEASDTVSYIAGTVETVPHLISYFDFHSKKVKNDVSVAQMLIQAGLDGLAGYVAGGGTFGVTPDPPTAYIGLAEGTILGAIVAGLGQLRTASYRYYCGFLYGICHGVIDSIEAVKVDERIVSFGAAAGDQFLIDDPQAWGGDHVDGGVYALCKAIPGNFWPTQAIDPYIAAQLGVNTASWSGKALFLMYGFSGYPESGYFAATPQGSPALRPLKLRVRRLPNNLGVPDFHDISGDANLAECAYEWLTSPTFGVKKLPLSKIDVASFQAGAETHFDRGGGVSLEMNADTDVETALDKFTALGDSIIYGSFNSGTIRYKVIERDYSIGSLPVFRRGPDGSSPSAYNVVKVDGFTPGSWANTANDFSFDYIDRDNNYLKATRYVQDVANKMLTQRTRSLSQSLEGVSNGSTAALVGTRELRAGSYPRPPINLTTNRDGYALEPGSVIKYIDNVDNFTKVLRVAEVQAVATDTGAECLLNCTEDQYGVGSAAFAPYVAPGFGVILHLHFEVEDSLGGFTDALSTFRQAAVGFADSFSLSDSVSIQLGGSLSLSLSDSVNNLTDSATASVGTNLLTLTLSDSVNNLADALDTGSHIYGVANTSIGFWLKADAQSFANNDPVGTWTDSSGLGNDATQSTSANKPTFKTGEINGLPAISFDGTNDKLNLANTSSALDGWSTSTIFVVLKPATNASNLSILCGQASGLQYRSETGSGKQQLLKTNITSIGLSSTALSTSSYQQINATFNAGSSYAFRLSSAADGSGSTAVTLAGNTNAIGWNEPAGGEYFSGLIAEIIVWKRVLSGTEISTVEAALLAKYGV